MWGCLAVPCLFLDKESLAKAPGQIDSTAKGHRIRVAVYVFYAHSLVHMHIYISIYIYMYIYICRIYCTCSMGVNLGMQGCNTLL